jgi:hypothetical protein
MALKESRSIKRYVAPPPIVNLSLVVTGVLIGLAGYEGRETPLGQVGLGAGGSLAAVGLAFFIQELFSN